MSLNPAIAKIRTLSAKKIAGEHSLTLGETIVFGLIVITTIPGIAAKIPFIKSHQKIALYGSLALLFIVLWMS